jgi:purine-nucleoside phosphorylase
MTTDADRVREAVRFLSGLTDIRPTLGLLTGTGLEDCAASLAFSTTVAYGDIPHFPLPTVEGHPGRLIFGRIGSCPVAVFKGRLHLYEGYSPRQVTFPIRVMQFLGVETLILTNAAGGLNPEFSAGDVMIVSDHINLTGASPLSGPNEGQWGIRFPDMSRAYTPELAVLAGAAGSETGSRLRRGIYAGLPGPSLETPAEVRFLRTIGADAVGFSTVQEVIAAVHGGMAVLALSTITNVHDPKRPMPVSVEDVMAVANAAAPRIDRIVQRIAGHRPGGGDP